MSVVILGGCIGAVVLLGGGGVRYRASGMPKT